MTDTVIKGTGNSRLIKSVPNLAALAPTYDKLLEMLSTEGLPVDISAPQAAGVDVFGTDYSKASVLPDTLCTTLGLATSATPAQALEKLRALNTTTSGKIPKIATGSYIGTKETSKTLNFGFKPKIVLISPAAKDGTLNGQSAVQPAIILQYGCTEVAGYNYGNTYGYMTYGGLNVSWSGNSVTWNGRATDANNSLDKTYLYFAIG